LETVSLVSKSLLADHKFEGAYYDPFSRKLSRSPGQYSSANSIFVRDFEFVSTRLGEAEAVMIFGRAI
jgi:hypothetical protein